MDDLNPIGIIYTQMAHTYSPCRHKKSMVFMIIAYANKNITWVIREYICLFA